jgi:hypothetical protein
MLAGITRRSHPALVARLKGLVIHPKARWGLAKVTVTFTIGEPGRAPGSGIPPYSYFLMLLESKTGGPSHTVVATGADGYYRATTYVPPGGIGGVEIGGFLNIPTGLPTARDGFWIPIQVTEPPH